VIAHAGAPEYEARFRLARAYQNVHIVTTMVGTPVMADSGRPLVQRTTFVGENLRGID
jgi:hypothetical protein